MGVGLSATSMIYHLRELLGRETEVIGGNVTDIDDVLTMNIRMTGYHSKAIEVSYRGQSRKAALKELLVNGGMYVLRNTDPYRLAVLYERREDTDKAEEIIREIIKSRPADRKWAYQLWASIKADTQGSERAIEMYQKAIEEDPKFALSRRSLGWAYYRDKELVQALEQFEKALQLDPRDPSAHNGAALCLRELGELDKAADHYESQVEAHPNVIWSYGNYSDFLMRYKQDTVGAMDLWKKASESIEESGDYYVALGAFALMKGDTIQAMAHGVTALDLEPDNVSVLSQFANYHYYEVEDYAEAEHFYRRLARVQDSKGYDIYMRMTAYNMLAMSEYQQEKFDSSLVHIQTAIDLMPENAYPWSTLAEIYILQGDIANFYKAIEESIRLGLPLEEFINEHPYNLIGDQTRLRRLIAKYKKDIALKG